MFIISLLKKNSSSSQLSPKKVAAQQNQDLATLNSGFVVKEKIGEGHYSVYTISTNANNRCFVLKQFPYVNCEPDLCYRNEARFSKYKHPNIVNIVLSEDRQQQPLVEGTIGLSSHIIMEHAPHGDFDRLIKSCGISSDEKLARTYFKQLIKGLKYLHKNKVAHLDIKPENLLLGSDFNLKITDFDVSYITNDERIYSNGSMSYRCPEMYKASRANSQNSHLKYPCTADIYSAGIMLFLLKTGANPYFEDRAADEVNYLYLMNNNNVEFWRKHGQALEKPNTFFSDSFVDLFNGMTHQNPLQRFTIKEIRKSKWYNGPVYTGAKLERKMKQLLNMKQST